MATYKVIQDIEAEDKLVGPLTLRQFIYAGICVICLYLAFVMISKGVGPAAAVFIPPAAVFGFLAFPWGGEQPTEVWALAKIQFMVKPRKRIWNQSGVKELVKVTAPKRVEQNYTNGLSQTEVRSRLKALADTIDSRGWVIKNVSGPQYSPNGMRTDQGSERLLGVSVTAAPTTIAALPAADDMLDVQHNPVAQKFDSMINASQKAHREEVIERMRTADQQPAPPQPPIAAPTPINAQPAADYWFLNQPTQTGSSVPQDAVTFNTQVVAPGTVPAALPVTAAVPTPDEEALIQQIKTQPPLLSPNMHGHLHVIQPLSAQGQQQLPPPPPVMPEPPQAADAGAVSVQAAQDQVAAAYASQQQASDVPAATQQPVTAVPDAAILDLARNDDLNVATIAREAQKRKESPDEVVISLH